MTALIMIVALMSRIDVVELGDTLCAEASGLPTREIAIIGRVAINRARVGGWSVSDEVSTPSGWAHGCPSTRMTRKFERLAKASIERRMKVPRWANRARAFCTKDAALRVGRIWRARGFVPIRGTKTVHVFWEKKRK